MKVLTLIVTNIGGNSVSKRKQSVAISSVAEEMGLGRGCHSLKIFAFLDDAMSVVTNH